MRLLLVEDDRHLNDALQKDLKLAGFAVNAVMDGETAEFLGATEAYDIVVLDLGLPKLSGLEVLQRWRAANNPVPVIVLTARDAWYEKVDGFKAGADDYLGKPFHVEELLARIGALLKRLHGQSQSQIEKFGIVLDEDQQVAIVDETRRVELTAAEFRLLRYLMLHPGKVLSRSHLAEHIYQQGKDPDSNVVEVYIKRLRQKLGQSVIQTRRGQGYVFGEAS